MYVFCWKWSVDICTGYHLGSGMCFIFLPTASLFLLIECNCNWEISTVSRIRFAFLLPIPPNHLVQLFFPPCWLFFIYFGNRKGTAWQWKGRDSPSLWRWNGGSPAGFTEQPLRLRLERLFDMVKGIIFLRPGCYLCFLLFGCNRSKRTVARALAWAAHSLTQVASFLWFLVSHCWMTQTNVNHWLPICLLPIVI